MALPAATNFGIGFLALFVMSLGTWGARGGDAPTLCYNFSITPRPSLGQPWCDIQGIIMKKTFLQYGCGDKTVELIGPLGTKLNDTEFWERQTETLQDLLEELKKKLLDMKAEDFPRSDSLSLQGWMVCVCGDNGRTSASWEFHIIGQIIYSFNSKNRNWSVHPEGRHIKAPFDSDRELTNSLMKISNGDCKKWLEKISSGMVHWDEMLGTTGRVSVAATKLVARRICIVGFPGAAGTKTSSPQFGAPDKGFHHCVSISAAPATNLGVTLVKATAIRPRAWILPQLLTCSVLLVLQGREL